MLLRCAILFSAGMMVVGMHTVSAQNYPNKPIRIVTAEPGGGSDFTSRMVAQGISAALNQQVIVDNRSSGVIPGEIVFRAAPDGYTLLVYNNILWIGPLMQKTPYDTVKDFAPVAMVCVTPSILVVNASLPAKSVKELIAIASAKPGELNYASTGTGASNHLTAELFKSLAKVNIVRVNYKSSGVALSGLIGGEVQLMFPTVTSGIPHVKSGKLRALAVTSAQPSVLAPGVPTMASSGLVDYEAITIFGVFAPARTPRPIVDKLNEETVRFLNKPEIKDKLFNAGLEAAPGSPAQLAATIKSDMTRMGKVIKDAGIRAE